MIFILYPQITQADLAEAASAELLCFLSSACEQCFFFKKKVWKSNSHKNSCSYYIKTSPAQWVLSSFLWNRFLKLLNAICPLSRADTLQRLHFWREGVCPLHTPVLEARSSSLAACSREMLLGCNDRNQHQNNDSLLLFPPVQIYVCRSLTWAIYARISKYSKPVLQGRETRGISSHTL